jgi:hypothetical protein
VLKPVSFLVDIVPVIVQELDKKPFDQPVMSNDFKGSSLAQFSELSSTISLIVNKTHGMQSSESDCDRPGGQAKPARQLTCPDKPFMTT